VGEGERPGRPRGSVVAMFAWPMALADRCERSACRAVPAQGPIGGFTPKGISLRGCVSGSLLWRSPPDARVGNGQDLSANEMLRAPIVRARPTHGPSYLMDLRRSEGSERSLAEAQRLTPSPVLSRWVLAGGSAIAGVQAAVAQNSTV
jgi:hypothetical protein